MHTPATHTPEQQSPAAVQLLPPLVQQVPSDRQVCVLGLQQSASAGPVQQISPALQHMVTVDPLLPAVQTPPAAQHAPSLQKPEQHWPSVVQLLPPLLQQLPSGRQVCVVGLQQSTPVPAQQIAPASQHTLTVVSRSPPVQTRPAAQQVPSALHMPEQQSLPVVQLLPPLVQQLPSDRQV